MIITKSIFLSFLAFLSFFNSAKDEVRVEMDQDQLNQLRDCKGNSLCFQDFYSKYTILNGVEASLKNFEELINVDEQYIGDCHYIFHGMGHGQYVRDDMDMGKAFADVSMENYFFRTLKTCGSGYYHGIVEEAAKNITGKESLIKMLSNACEEITKKGLDSNNCYHGMGHAVLIQLDGDINDSLEVCDSVTNKKDMVDSCHSGVFMEMSRDYDLSKDNPDTGMMSLKKCDSLPLKYQAECYNQQSYLFIEFATNQEFVDNLNKCQEIEDQVKRIYCVRTFVK